MQVRPGQQVEELENEADLLAAQTRQVVVGKLAHAPAIDANLTRCRPIQTANQIQQRRLAGTGRPHDKTISPRAISRSIRSRAVTWRLPLSSLETPVSEIIR
jgi:hypothetical protein